MCRMTRRVMSARPCHLGQVLQLGQDGGSLGYPRQRTLRRLWDVYDISVDGLQSGPFQPFPFLPRLKPFPP